MEMKVSLEESFSQAAGSQPGRRRTEEGRLHLFPPIALRKRSSDPLLSSQGNGEEAQDAHSLQPRRWDGKLLCPCWDPQPEPLRGVMDEREEEEEEAAS